jgi:pyruvate formate lyase activating enzyme
MKEALFYHISGLENVQCDLCPNGCLLSKNKTGRCGVYKNINQKLMNIHYGQIVSLAMDPIEKKPLYHFFPKTHILSAGFFGCNLSCQFCQNFSLSFGEGLRNETPIPELLEIAKKHHSLGIAFTYNEPTVMYEYVKDACRIFKENNLKTVLVTNGYVNPKPLEELLPMIDAMNIDLKSMRNSFYEKICFGKLDPVLETIRTCYNKCHIEITNLVIPGENDLPQDFEKLADFLHSLNPEIPVHLSRYFPNYHFTTPPTELETLKLGYDIVRKKMKYVYLGNVAKGE